MTQEDGYGYGRNETEENGIWSVKGPMHYYLEPKQFNQSSLTIPDLMFTLKGIKGLEGFPKDI